MVQYRMHPQILSFPNETFYAGKVQSAKGLKEQPLPSGFSWPDESHVAVVNVADGKERRDSASSSLFNKDEAKTCYRIAKRLKSVACVAVITFYRAQVDELRRRCQKLTNVTIDTVDAFQGKEADVVIISTVRSGGKVGFLSEARRINVALTRAKTGLILVGSVQTMRTDLLLSLWLDHYAKSGSTESLPMLTDADI